MTSCPPFVLFFLAALALPVCRGVFRNGVLLVTPVISGIGLIGLEAGGYWQISLLGYALEPYRVDALSLVFGYFFHIAAFICFVFALHLRDTIQQIAGVCYAGSALGAIFAGDLITLFIFWELMALSSALLVWARRTPESLASGMRYLIMQLGSGVLLLAGAALIAYRTGDIQFGAIGLDDPATGGLASWLILLAFGIKCAFPLLHHWLTDAYAEATPTGTVFLSAFTTKVAVYCLARAYAGSECLIYVGVVMACFPIVYAVIENDVRRALAYSMISQLGFIVCAVGVGTSLAVNAAVAYAVVFKGLLFMVAGMVLHVTGKRLCSELGGLYRTMPMLAVFGVLSAASIAAIPPFSSFIGKSLIMSATDGQAIWFALLFAQTGLFLVAGAKIPYILFFSKPATTVTVSKPPVNMLIAIAFAVAGGLFFGLQPQLFYALLPEAVSYTPYSASYIAAKLQLFCFALLAWVYLNRRGLCPNHKPAINLDAEWFYRKWLPAMGRGVVNLARCMQGIGERFFAGVLSGISSGCVRIYGGKGWIAKIAELRDTLAIIVMFLCVVSFFYLFNIK